MANKSKRNQAQKEEDHSEEGEEFISRADLDRMLAGREAEKRAEEERAEHRLIAAEERELRKEEGLRE